MNLVKKQTLLSIASLSCCIHCIFTPFLITLFPFTSNFFHIEGLEIGLLLISICCGTYIITKGYCKHKKTHTIFLFGLGVFLWISHLFVESLLTFDAEIIFILLGSICVVISYIFNHNFLKCCPNIEGSEN